MNKLFTLITGILIALSAFAQSPQKMSYQCVIRNSSGSLVTNQSVGIRISILQGTTSGTVVYQETYDPNPQTNANGLVTVEIGGGMPTIGTFSTIDWASGPYFLMTETDPTGGTNYTITGTNQLLSVPYAFYANTTSNDKVLKQQIKILEDNLIAAGIYKLSDCEGNLYNVIKIGTQTWMKENLRTTKYNDCTDIPLVTNDAEWSALTTPAYCWYNNDISNKDTYGALYNGHAIITGILDKFADTPNTYNVAKDKLCPIGWHVPTIDDWRILADPYRLINMGSGSYGYGLMESGTSHWISGLGTNESGFTALPGGMHEGTVGGFFQYGTLGNFWSSSIDYGHAGQMRYFPVPFDQGWDRMVTASLYSPKNGLSVRCLKDN